MRKPYRVAVWGPGHAGRCAIRELNRLPEVELVSVLAYSAKKNGVDAGTLVGIEPIGVTVTTDIAAFLSTKPECVIHTPRDFGDFRADDDIVMMLEKGINVITVLPYQYLKGRGKEAEQREQRLTDAAKKGGATLFGTGINPGFIGERVGLVMTGISNDVQSISLQEFVNMKCEIGKPPPRGQALFGFGSTLETIAKNSAVLALPENYLLEVIYYLGDKLGMPVDRIERTPHHVVTDSNRTIVGLADDTACIISYKWVGYCGERPFISIQVTWYLNETVRPAIAKGDDYWQVEVEGQPSSRVGIEIQGSFKNNLVELPNNPTAGAWFVTVIPAIQAIPHVIEAKPGILLPDASRMHWKPDMRMEIALD